MLIRWYRSETNAFSPGDGAVPGLADVLNAGVGSRGGLEILAAS